MKVFDTQVIKMFDNHKRQHKSMTENIWPLMQQLINEENKKLCFADDSFFGLKT